MTEQRQYRGAGIILMVLGVFGLLAGYWVHIHTPRGRGWLIMILGALFFLAGAVRHRRRRAKLNTQMPPGQTPPAGQ
ncbi:MAG TPA: hypothetical protein VHA30_02705 [Patescibacteria group bacterium]|nr:hypothetical protein [Patescibacteria group bacterium]